MPRSRPRWWTLAVLVASCAFLGAGAWSPSSVAAVRGARVSHAGTARAAAEDVAAAPEATRVRDTGAGQMQVYAIAGKVRASKIPDWEIDLDPAMLKAPSGKYSVAVAALALDENREPPRKTFGKMQATLYAVDGDGSSRRLRAKTVKAKKSDGGAEYVFTRLKAPGSHFRLEVNLLGGSVRDGSVLFQASVAPGARPRVPGEADSGFGEEYAPDRGDDSAAATEGR